MAKRPIKIFTLDTETEGLSGALKRIAIYDGEHVRYGYTFDDVEPYFIEEYHNGYSVHVYIHNADFDLRKLEGVFRKENVNWNATRLINGRYAVLACRFYTFHDSFKLLPMSLSALSKGFDVEHGKLDLWEQVQKKYGSIYKDIGDYFIRCAPDDPLYVEYLGYDVMSLYEVIEKLMEVTGIEVEAFVKKLSTASLSKHIFRHGYNGHKFHTPGHVLSDFEEATSFKQWSSRKKRKDAPTFHEIEQRIRKAYFGGRTEVFTPRLAPTGSIAGYHYDINSLYPSEMIDNLYPIGNPDYCKGVKARITWESWLKTGSGLGFIKASVYVPKQAVPPLPANRGKLVFLTGYQEGTWTYKEMEYAVKECGVKIHKIIEVIHFKQTAKIFHNFVSLFYKMKAEGKKQGNPALTTLAKLLLNTGYGYFALIRERDDVRNINEITKHKDKLIYANEDLGYIKIETEVLSDTVQVQIASYVTSYARLALLKMARLMEKRGRIYYCDTDSLVTDTPLPPEHVDPLKLGAWDLEGELMEGYFLFPKVYTEVLEEKTNIKFKGVSKSTQKNMDVKLYEDLYQKLCSGSTSRVLVEENKELLRSISYAQKTKQDPNRLEYRDKYISLSHTPKRDINFEKNYSLPWHMNTLQEFKDFDLTKPVMKYETYGNLFDTTT